ncbi:hypothetical protein K474DRAFT_1578497, partial [Panus rudis PR-1116 ss-1]
PLYAAQRPSRTTKETRRSKLDGVVIPPSADQRAKIKGKQREVRAEKEHSLTEEQVPIDTHVPQYDPHNDNDIMEDIAPTPAQDITEKVSKIGHPKKQKKDSPPVKRQPNQSAVSQRVQPLEILNRILATPVSLSVGEVIGSSRDISYNLSSILKYKKAGNEKQAQNQETVAAALFKDSKESLIELLVNCNGKTVEAIVD